MLESDDPTSVSTSDLLASITGEAVASMGGIGGAGVTFTRVEDRAVFTGIHTQGVTSNTLMAHRARIGGEHIGVNVLELPHQERLRSNSLTLRRVRPLAGASLQLVRDHYPKEGIGDEALRHLCDGRRVLGFVAVHRDPENRRFALRDLDALDGHGVAWRRRLLRALAVEEGFDGLTAALLFHASGSLGYASSAGARWLDAERRARCEEVARAVASGRLPAGDVIIDAAVTARFSRLHGQGHAQVLATLSPTHPVLVSPLVDLSPRQRRVAAYAAAGANAFEIAEDMGLSPHTVRDHLKVIYRTLGVSSRAALAKRLAEETGP